MFNGTRAIIYSTDAEADRVFLRDVVGLGYVDVGAGWLIFGLPPTELAVHPSEKNNIHELFFTVKDIHGFMEEMALKGVPCEALQATDWGDLTRIALPGGGSLGVYQPRHARANGWEG